jgi:hypothetical protein
VDVLHNTAVSLVAGTAAVIATVRRPACPLAPLLVSGLLKYQDSEKMRLDDTWLDVTRL